jgi:hypothetical protein
VRPFSFPSMDKVQLSEHSKRGLCSQHSITVAFRLCIVAYLLKARNAKPTDMPLLSNGLSETHVSTATVGHKNNRKQCFLRGLCQVDIATCISDYRCGFGFANRFIGYSRAVTTISSCTLNVMVIINTNKVFYISLH